MGRRTGERPRHILLTARDKILKQDAASVVWLTRQVNPSEALLLGSIIAVIMRMFQIPEAEIVQPPSGELVTMEQVKRDRFVAVDSRASLSGSAGFAKVCQNRRVT